LEEHVASLFRFEEQAKQGTSMKKGARRESGLWETWDYIEPGLDGVISQNIGLNI
jgi:hypothetical protein